jgi:hypothetical protein
MGALRELRSYGEPGAVVYLADCVELMRLMPPGCADVIFADPPYRLSSGGVTVKSGRLASGDIRRAGAGKGSRAGEIVLDRSEIPLSVDEMASLIRVEVEVDTSVAHPMAVWGLKGFVEEMEGTLGLEPTRVSKYEAGLFATGLIPEGDSDLGSDFVDDSLSIVEVTFAVLRRQFAIMRAHEAGTRLGKTPKSCTTCASPRGACRLRPSSSRTRCRSGLAGSGMNLGSSRV